MDIVLEKVEMCKKDILFRLLQYSLFEESISNQNDINKSVMINTYMQKSSEGHSIAEFMVLPKFRRNKIGKKATLMCFDKHKGNWEVSPSYGSLQAYSFWENVVHEYAGKDTQYEDGRFLFSTCD